MSNTHFIKFVPLSLHTIVITASSTEVDKILCLIQVSWNLCVIWNDKYMIN